MFVWLGRAAVELDVQPPRGEFCAISVLHETVKELHCVAGREGRNDSARREVGWEHNFCGVKEFNSRVVTLPRSIQNAENHPYCTPSHPLPLPPKVHRWPWNYFVWYSQPQLPWKKKLQVNFTIFVEIVHFVQNFGTLNASRVRCNGNISALLHFQIRKTDFHGKL